MKINVRLTYADGQTHDIEHVTDLSNESRYADYWRDIEWYSEHATDIGLNKLRKVEILGEAEEAAPCPND